MLLILVLLLSMTKISSISFQFLFHSKGFSFSLRFSLKCCLHGIKSLGLVLSNHSKLFILLSNATLNLSLYLGQLHLATEHFVFLLFQRCFSFFQGRLQLQFFSLKALADFVNFMNGSSSLSDLIHNISNFI